MVLGFIGIMLAGASSVYILLQLKMEASLPLTLFCVVSWLLFILAVFKTLEGDYEAEQDDKKN